MTLKYLNLPNLPYLPMWRFGVAVTRWSRSTQLLYIEPGYTSRMGDCLRVGKLSHYVTSHPGQLSLAIPPWVGAMSTGDGYGHR